IWEFDAEDEESACLAQWIKNEVQAGSFEPHEVAILVRQRADDVEERLAPMFTVHGLRLRNVARKVGDIAIQDLLSEDLTHIILRLLRLGASDRSPEHWTAALQDIQVLEAIDPDDEVKQQRIQERLQKFASGMRRLLKRLDPVPESAVDAACKALNFIGANRLRQAFPAYQRQPDFDRVWNGFLLLLQESLQQAGTWSDALDRFEGRGQVPLMTIHKSKGLEFHTIVFYGLDNNTWWSLKPDRKEELNSFFVAFTRAKQRAFFTLCTNRGKPIDWLENILLPAGVRWAPLKTER
ncbi:MAG: 3'-5' exonuclease, partial [Roseiflexaceae bacterium]|nr:3'-5' exonuclease [Roseiflexaceae bacterium]